MVPSELIIDTQNAVEFYQLLNILSANFSLDYAIVLGFHPDLNIYFQDLRKHIKN